MSGIEHDLAARRRLNEPVRRSWRVADGVSGLPDRVHRQGAEPGTFNS